MFKILSGLLIMLSLNFSVSAATEKTEEMTEINIHTRFGLTFDRALVVRPVGETQGAPLKLHHLDKEVASGTSSISGVIEIGYFYRGYLYPLFTGTKGSLKIPRNLSLKHENMPQGDVSEDLEIPHTLTATLVSSTGDWTSDDAKPSGDNDVYAFERISESSGDTPGNSDSRVLKYRITSDIVGVNIGIKPSGEYTDISTLTVKLDTP